MRIAVALAVALVVATPAAGAEVDPRSLVLRTADVPSGFRVDRDGTGVRTNAAEVKDHPELAPLVRRWGRLTGYEVELERGDDKIEARADLFRLPSGARQILDWYDREVRKAGLGGLRRSRIAIGDKGWVYHTPMHPAAATIVVWRYGRVFAGVLGQGITADRTRALARAQQRRIAAALR